MKHSGRQGQNVERPRGRPEKKAPMTDTESVLSSASLYLRGLTSTKGQEHSGKTKPQRPAKGKARVSSFILLLFFKDLFLFMNSVYKFGGSTPVSWGAPRVQKKTLDPLKLELQWL